MLASSASKDTPVKNEESQASMSDITPKQKLAQLKSRLEESWGSHEKLIEELQYANKPVAAILEENYDEDFEKNEEIEDETTEQHTLSTNSEGKKLVVVTKKLSSHTQPQGYEDDEDDKIVDEEFNLTSSVGSNSGSSKKDSDFLNELMKPPIRTKIVSNTS